jgi:hypothetical protein
MWVALHHLMEYLEGFSSLKLIYWRHITATTREPAEISSVSTRGMLTPTGGTAHPAVELQQLHVWKRDGSDAALQQVSYHVALKEAKDYCSLHGIVGALLGIASRRERLVPLKPPQTTLLRSAEPHTGARGQHCLHRVGK